MLSPGGIRAKEPAYQYERQKRCRFQGMATHSSIPAPGNPMDRGAWWVIVHRVAKSWIRLKWLSTHTLNIIFFCHISFYSSVQFSPSVVSDSLQPHGLQHARPPCPSPTPGFYSNSCPLNRWYHPTISFSVISLSSCLQSFPASGSFQMSQLFTSGGQIIGVSASASEIPMNIQDWFPLGWTGRILLLSKGLSRVLSNTTVQKHQFFSALYGPALTSIHNY